LPRKFEEVRTAKARNIIGASTGAEVLVAESAHEVIGLIVIRLAARASASRRQGVGSALLEAACAWADS